MSTDADALAPQSVRDGNRILRFLGREVSRSSSARPGVQRWSELVAYETATGSWICQRIGHSTVAHKPECVHVTRRMPSWLDAHEEAIVHRTPCPECQPLVGDRMDPHTRLEAQRYTVLQAQTAAELAEMLIEGREQVPGMIQRIVSGIMSK